MESDTEINWDEDDEDDIENVQEIPGMKKSSVRLLSLTNAIL